MASNVENREDTVITLITHMDTTWMASNVENREDTVITLIYTKLHNCNMGCTEDVNY